MAAGTKQIEASRRSHASPEHIFGVLAEPRCHLDLDGSGMNYVVEFDPPTRIFREPAPGDPSRADDNDSAKAGIPAGYRWGYVLTPDCEGGTVLAEVFDPRPMAQELLSDGVELGQREQVDTGVDEGDPGAARQDQCRVCPPNLRVGRAVHALMG